MTMIITKTIAATSRSKYTKSSSTSSAGGGSNVVVESGGGSSVEIIKTTNSVLASDSNVYSALRTNKEISTRAISKLVDDEVAGNITFDQDIHITGKLYAATANITGTLATNEVDAVEVKATNGTFSNLLKAAACTIVGVLTAATVTATTISSTDVNSTNVTSQYGIFSKTVSCAGIESSGGEIIYGEYSILPLGIGTYIINSVDDLYGARILASNGLINKDLNIGAMPTENVFSETLKADGTIQFGYGISTSTYVSQTTGWGVSVSGSADFREIYADELRVQSFTADISQALAGSDFLTKSVTKLSSNFIIPSSVGGTVSIIVDDLEGFPATRCFVDGDYIRLRAFNRTSGLTIDNVWGTVTLDTTFGTSGFLNNTQRYIFTVISLGGGGGLTVFKGSEILDYGTSGNGVIARTVLDSAGSPYEQISTWVTDPSVSTNYTVHARLGNLAGIANCSGYGLYSDKAFLTSSILVGDLTKTGEYLEYVSGSLDIHGKVYVTGGNAATTTNVSDAVNNIVIGGTNMAFLTSTGKSIVGTNAYDISTKLYDLDEAAFGNEVTVSFKWSYSGGTSTTGLFYLQLNSPLWTEISSHISLGTAASSGNSKLTVTIPAYANNRDILIRTDYMDGDLIVSKLKVEIGNKATTWSPNPSDYDTALEDAQDIIANGLGYADFQTLFDTISDNETIISGGKIRTSLIIASEVVTQNLVASVLSASSATISLLTVSSATISGCTISNATVTGTLNCANAYFTSGTFTSITIANATITGTLTCDTAIFNNGTFTDATVTGKITAANGAVGPFQITSYNLTAIEGTVETDRLTLSSGVTTNGMQKITLGGTIFNISVTTSYSTSILLAAYLATKDYGDWVTSYTSGNNYLEFVCNFAGVKTTPVFNANGTGASGVFTIPTSGTTDNQLLLNSALIRFNNANNWVYIGGNVMPSTLGGTMDCPIRIECSRVPNTGEYSNSGMYISVTGSTAYDDSVLSGNHAFYIAKGNICGFRLRGRRVSTSQTLSIMDSIIFSNAASDITLTLPSSDVEDWQPYYIRKCAAGNVTIQRGGTTDHMQAAGDFSGSSDTSIIINNASLYIIIYDKVNNIWRCSNMN
jgi:hypothetical protein